MALLDFAGSAQRNPELVRDSHTQTQRKHKEPQKLVNGFNGFLIHAIRCTMRQDAARLSTFDFSTWDY